MNLENITMKEIIEKDINRKTMFLEQYFKELYCIERDPKAKRYFNIRYNMIKSKFNFTDEMMRSNYGLYKFRKEQKINDEPLELSLDDFNYER